MDNGNAFKNGNQNNKRKQTWYSIIQEHSTGGMKRFETIHWKREYFAFLGILTQNIKIHPSKLLKLF